MPRRVAPLLALALAAALLGAACSSGAQVPAPLAMGQPFTLRPGQSRQLAEPPLVLGFERVLSDSRCPRGEQCVWAGEAVLRLWWQAGSGPRQAVDLRVGAGAPARVGAGHALQALRLDPAPVAGKPAAQAETTATLVLIAAPAGAPER
jgi:hypothetical protein